MQRLKQIDWEMKEKANIRALQAAVEYAIKTKAPTVEQIGKERKVCFRFTPEDLKGRYTGMFTDEEVGKLALPEGWGVRLEK